MDNSLREIKLLEQEISRINENLDSIYLDKLNNVISEEQFNRVKIKLENELNIKQDKLMKLLLNLLLMLTHKHMFDIIIFVKC